MVLNSTSTRFRLAAQSTSYSSTLYRNALVRTIEQNNEMYLVNNNYNDYYIADKTFSGGIYRTTLRAQVKSESTTYGFGFKGKLPYADDVYYWNKGSDSWLTMEGLVEDHKTAAQDDEKLDLKAKNTNQYKSEFVYKLVPSETTDAGSYPVKYIGLNEFNYDLLKNYVVTEDPGLRYYKSVLQLHIQGSGHGYTGQ